VIIFPDCHAGEGDETAGSGTADCHKCGRRTQQNLHGNQWKAIKLFGNQSEAR